MTYIFSGADEHTGQEENNVHCWKEWVYSVQPLVPLFQWLSGGKKIVIKNPIHEPGEADEGYCKPPDITLWKVVPCDLADRGPDIGNLVEKGMGY